MNAETKEKLILSLIKDDLINAKLVNGLNEMGLKAEGFYLHLTDTIFELMDFEDNEETQFVFERYVEFSKKAACVDVSQSHEAMDALALEVYLEVFCGRLDE